MPTANELLIQIEEATVKRTLAKAKIDTLKREILYAESDLIEANLIIERANEALRHVEDAIVHADVSEKALEIAAFQKKFPQLCEVARLRDMKGDKNGSRNNS